MSKRVNSAVALFEEGYVCSQSVFAAYCDTCGLEKDYALRMGTGFGGGIAGKQEICGSIIGAITLIGLKYGNTQSEDTAAKEKAMKMTDDFCNKFIERNKSINCRELLGCDLTSAREKGLFKTLCVKYVRDAAEIVEELLDKQDE